MVKGIKLVGYLIVGVLLGLWRAHDPDSGWYIVLILVAIGLTELAVIAAKKFP